MKDYWKEGLGTFAAAIVLGMIQLWINNGYKLTESQLVGQSQPSKQQTDADLAMWQGIANSDNPSDFEEYLARYPNGQFVRLAKNRLQNLGQEAVAIQSPPEDLSALNEDEPLVVDPPQTDRHYEPPLAESDAPYREGINSNVETGSAAYPDSAARENYAYSTDRTSLPVSSLRENAQNTYGRVQPSFNCNRAKHFSEIAVCESDELATLDLQLNTLYKQALARRPSADKKALKQQERDWVENVMYACQTHDCIRNAYISRIRELEW